ncbi:XRE family transcriptional regulator [Lactococcus taiwanensis]|uniref:XRE family transcriptional regulator n=1 Tax=Lactococcus taiwanensis TaxID=1151742 RepID=UPI003511CB68
MDTNSRFKIVRKKANLTQKQVAEKLGIKYQVYQRWESGKVQVRDPEMLNKLASVLGTTVEYLTNTEILPIYQQLSETRQANTISFATKQLEEQKNENKIIQLQDSLVPYEVEEEQALSAGRGEAYTVEYGKEIVYWDKDIKHDRAIVIRGNSMEPDYLYGQIALIKYQNFVDVPGDIYAVDDIDRGLAYIKSVFVEDGYLRLVSLNDDVDLEGNRLFPDILLPCDENSRIIGKVVAAFTPIDLTDIYY